jgi:hypothetical protein
LDERLLSRDARLEHGAQPARALTKEVDDAVGALQVVFLVVPDLDERIFDREEDRRVDLTDQGRDRVDLGFVGLDGRVERAFGRRKGRR